MYLQVTVSPSQYCILKSQIYGDQSLAPWDQEGEGERGRRVELPDTTQAAGQVKSEFQINDESLFSTLCPKYFLGHTCT